MPVVHAVISYELLQRIHIVKTSTADMPEYLGELVEQAVTQIEREQQHAQEVAGHKLSPYAGGSVEGWSFKNLNHGPDVITYEGEIEAPHGEIGGGQPAFTADGITVTLTDGTTYVIPWHAVSGPVRQYFERITKEQADELRRRYKVRRRDPALWNLRRHASEHVEMAEAEADKLGQDDEYLTGLPYAQRQQYLAERLREEYAELDARLLQDAVAEDDND